MARESKTAVDREQPRTAYQKLWLTDEQDVPPGPWSRREGEDELWYSRFLHYLGLGPSRTRAATRRASVQSLTGPVPHSRVEEWDAQAAAFDWLNRARAWDEFIDEMVLVSSREAQTVLRRFAPEAAWALVRALDDSKTSVQAAKEILDRVGPATRTKQDVSLTVEQMTDDQLDREIQRALGDLGYTAQRKETETRGAEDQVDAVG